MKAIEIYNSIIENATVKAEQTAIWGILRNLSKVSPEKLRLRREEALAEGASNIFFLSYANFGFSPRIFEDKLFFEWVDSNYPIDKYGSFVEHQLRGLVQMAWKVECIDFLLKPETKQRFKIERKFTDDQIGKIWGLLSPTYINGSKDDFIALCSGCDVANSLINSALNNRTKLRSNSAMIDILEYLGYSQADYPKALIVYFGYKEKEAKEAVRKRKPINEKLENHHRREIRAIFHA